MSFSTYIPLPRNIAAITQTFPAFIQTTQNHGYNQGLIVRIVIPYSGSMSQINNQFGIALVIAPNAIALLGVDSRNYLPFTLAPLVQVVKPPNPPFFVNSQQAQVIPIAEVNRFLINAVDNVPI